MSAGHVILVFCGLFNKFCHCIAACHKNSNKMALAFTSAMLLYLLHCVFEMYILLVLFVRETLTLEIK